MSAGLQYRARTQVSKENGYGSFRTVAADKYCQQSRLLCREGEPVLAFS